MFLTSYSSIAAATLSTFTQKPIKMPVVSALSFLVVSSLTGMCLWIWISMLATSLGARLSSSPLTAPSLP